MTNYEKELDTLIKAQPLIVRAINALANLLFGWRKYRVDFIYKAPNGQALFMIQTTASVRYALSITNTRAMKKSIGPIYDLDETPKHLLCNGTLTASPVCYLGRWRNRH